MGQETESNPNINTEILRAESLTTLQAAMAAGMLMGRVNHAQPNSARDQPYVIVPKTEGGFEVVDISPKLYPDRAWGAVRLDAVESFIAFVKAHKEEGTTIYALPQKETVFSALAVLNDHGAEPGFRDFRATLTPPASESFKVWSASSGHKFTGNVEFAEFLEDHFPEIVEPSGATMMELATNFAVHAEVSFSNPVSLSDGATQLTMMKTVAGGANTPTGKVTIPKRFVIEIPVHRGGPPYRFEAHFRFRIGGSGGVTIWYNLIRPDLVLEAVMKEALAVIGTETMVPVLLGDGSFEVK